MDYAAIYQEYIISLPTISKLTADLRIVIPEARYILDEIDHREHLLKIECQREISDIKHQVDDINRGLCELSRQESLQQEVNSIKNEIVAIRKELIKLTSVCNELRSTKTR
jgi:chromosome segregation ATPase